LYVFLSTMVSESRGLAACGHQDLPLRNFESDQVLFRNLTSIAGRCFESPEDMYVAYRIALVRMRLQGNLPMQLLAGVSQPGGDSQSRSLVSQPSKASNIRSFSLLPRAGSDAGVSSPANRSPSVMMPSVSSSHTAGDAMILASPKRAYTTATSDLKPDRRSQHLNFL
jgi:rRNA maturation protein Nop10